MNNNISSCLWSQKPAILSFPSLFNGLALVVVGFLTFGLVGVGRIGFFLVPVLELVVAVLMVGVTVKRVKLTVYVVFDYGVCKEQHLPYKLSVLAFSKIAEVTVSYGFLGRLFRFGTVTIHSACISCSNLVFTGVKSPEGLRRLILATKENPK